MSLFDRAMACPPGERTDFVRQEAVDDPPVREQVLGMLEELVRSAQTEPGAPGDNVRDASHRAGGSAWGLPHGRGSEAPSLPGTRVGPYRVLRMLKRGGMGEVYQAIREDHFESPVALKVIRGAIVGPVAIDRFWQERQILASLEHPNIARIIDAGSLPDGRPFLVLDYVDGLPVTEFCDRHRMRLRDRMRIFDRICDAIQYAHGQLVVHRDIKPGNILVTADGVPKLLDFGIAKLMSPGGRSLFDITGPSSETPRTPAYASPEQLRGDPVQTTGDVYHLGVLLYELLVGARPFSSAETHARAEREILPVLPSQMVHAEAARVKGAPGEPDARARARGTTRIGLARALRGDLDVIVTTALRWDPRLRYQSVEALRDDLRRNLDRHPIVARPRRPMYVAGRFVRRHLASVSAAAALVASLGLGLGGTFSQWQRAEELRRAAEQRDVVGAAFLESILERVAKALERDPRNAEVQRGFMEQAAQYLGRRQAEAGRNLSVIKSVATGYSRVADLQGNPSLPNVGQPDEALNNFDHAVRLMEYVRSGNEDADALLGISSSHLTMGDIYSEQHQPELARERYALAQAAALRLTEIRNDEVARRQLATARSRLTDGFQAPAPPVADSPPDPDPAEPMPAPRRQSAAPAPPAALSSPPPRPPAISVPEAGWVAIPAGRFDMGCEPQRDTTCLADERPRHTVSVDAFEIMAAEATVALFTKYALAAGVAVPPQPRWSTDSSYPIVGVRWSDASRFCAAIGGRLPTEAEWEYAARGGRTTQYPWGDEWEPRRANYFFPLGDGHEFPVPRDVFPANDYGLFNTVGNVWEWVSDWYDAAYYAQSLSANPRGPAAGTRHGLRGGSFRTRKEFMRVTKRGQEGLDPTAEQTGVRCAHS